MRRSAILRALWLLAGLLLGLGLVWAGRPLLERALPQRAGDENPVLERRPPAGTALAATGTLALRLETELKVEHVAAELDGAPAPLEVEGPWLYLRPETPLRPGGHTLELSAQPGIGGGGSRALPRVAFEVREPTLIYLHVAAGRRELVRNQEDRQITLSARGSVLAYALAPAGEQVAYAAANELGGADLWAVGRAGEERRRLLHCGADRCIDLDWSPRGDRLAFVRAEPSGQGLSTNRIWTLHLTSGEAAPLYQDPARRGQSPRWSPDGRWLSYYDPTVSGLRVLDLDTVEEGILPTGASLPGAWAPDGSSLLAPVLTFHGEAAVTELHRLDLETEEVEELLTRDDGWSEVSVPAWAPDGEWVALSARRDGVAGLFRLRPSGQGVELLAGGDGAAYGSPAWDPWGDQLIFQRFSLGGPGAVPDLYLWPGGGTEPSLAVQGAASGSWLP